MWRSLIIPAILFRRFTFPFEYLWAGKEQFVYLDILKPEVKMPFIAEIEQMIQELCPGHSI